MNRSRAGWNPSRRNRNIGSAQQGHGQNNRLEIPNKWGNTRDSRIYWERLNHPVAVQHTIEDRPLTVLVGPTLADFTHCCTVADIVCLFRQAPSEHRRHIETIVLRQPTRKEHLLNPCWGRLAYWSDLDPYFGPTIYLDAQCLNERWRFDLSTSPHWAQELTRLEADGHEIQQDRRYRYVLRNLEACRTTQLYRTLLHELGHYVDYWQSVECHFNKVAADEYDYLDRCYYNQPSEEREAFAHRYAHDVSNMLRDQHLIPFPRQFDRHQLIADGLNPQWFEPNRDISPKPLYTRR